MFSLLQEAATTAVEISGDEAVVIDETAATGAATYDGAQHAAESAGLPQLDVTTFANQIFWLVVTLVILYLVLSRVALPRIAAVLSDRQGAMTGDLMAAEEFKQKAREAEAAYDKALAEARTEAQRIVALNRAGIQAELDAAIAHADAEIGARTAESEGRIRDIRTSADVSAREVAREVTASLVETFGGSVDAATVDRAVDSRMKGALQ
ncbi:MAG: F0F1 ATP synthase subunit B' [Paracoccus sp. (in: a-proteobacteria)]|uniref:F0F1 ATP synthase subunit B' n=1 Tax=Paracoccus sp. TaxID=267 RepID=UPI00391D0F9B